MPELPEVETTRRHLALRVSGRRVLGAEVRCRSLRWPVDPEIVDTLPGSRVVGLGRRGKTLLIETDRGVAISHFGMSGRWSWLEGYAPPGPHDHVDLELEDGAVLRYHDPRRFGALLWAGDAPDRHPHLAGLGPEPWGGAGPEEIGAHLWRRSRRRRGPLRNFLLDGRNVAGVGNIYASEATHRAGIHPGRAAGRISSERYIRLAEALAEVLGASIARGGTTLRDFRDPEGSLGRYGEACLVYGRAGAPCPRCGGTIRRRVHTQRSFYYCPGCQR